MEGGHMDRSGNQDKDAQRTRRNIAKMGAVGVAALLASFAESKRSMAAPTCFLRGSRIRTANGDRNVENLSIGDFLPTAFGGMRRVQWIVRYRYLKSDPTKPWVSDVRPVRVAYSALDRDVPHADLYLTKGHSLFIDGVLVPVANLINSTTITLCDGREFDELEYFHIKLDSHDVIYAEGAPCETLLTVNESDRNFADYLRRYGPPNAAEVRCAPLVGYKRTRGSEFKSRLRSAASPWVDRRQTIDIIRDRLEERGVALLRQPMVI
jgi:hypothetical protein